MDDLFVNCEFGEFVIGQFGRIYIIIIVHKVLFVKKSLIVFFGHNTASKALGLTYICQAHATTKFCEISWPANS